MSLKFSRYCSIAATGMSVAVVAGSLFVAAPANAADTDAVVPDGVIVDPSFDPTNAVTVNENGQRQIGLRARNECHDRAFALIPTMLTSTPGCSIIGSSKNTKLTYSWYRDKGKTSACIWAKGFNSRTQTTWTEAGCGTGRRGVVVSWGNVAASKQVKGLAVAGVAGVQWG